MVLKNIKDYKVVKLRYAAYVPILDKDPCFAAHFLTKKDLKRAYNLMRETFSEIKEDKVVHEIMAETILASKDNFMWFCSFFKEMEKILGTAEIYKLPYSKCPEKSGKAPEVYQPFTCVPLKANEPIYIRYLNINSKVQDPINNYRITYIMAEYDLSDFQDDCYPGWYLIKNTTVFEQYNEKTNRRVRIEFRNGEFLYFVAGASDNWQIINGVPPEMDHVIAALLFRNL